MCFAAGQDRSPPVPGQADHATRDTLVPFPDLRVSLSGCRQANENCPGPSGPQVGLMLVIFGDRIQYHKDTCFRVPACKEDKWQKEGQGLKFSIKKKSVSRAWCESTFRRQQLQTQARWGVSPMEASSRVKAFLPSSLPTDWNSW